MAGSVFASINFYSTEEAGIRTATIATTEREEIEAELACISLFACRSLINLGHGMPADKLANLLAMMGSEGIAALTLHDSKEHWLVPFRGPAKQRFEVSLNMEPFSFNVHIKGFGVRGKGLNWYGCTAVTSLIQHICRTRRSPEIFGPLATTLFQVACAHHSGVLSLPNQHHIALSAWAMGLAEFEEDTSTDNPGDVPSSIVTAPRRRTEPLRARGR